MKTQFLMGNEAIALGAIAAGVNAVAGYPGTPSTEVLETVAKNNNGNIYVEWSINEKAAMELTAGAAGERIAASRTAARTSASNHLRSARQDIAASAAPRERCSR